MCYMIAETGDCPFCKAIMRQAPTLPRDEITRATRAGRRTPSPTRSPATRATTPYCACPSRKRAVAAIDAFEERYVLHLLGRTHNASKAARLAGIDRNYLYRMRKKHGIARKE